MFPISVNVSLITDQISNPPANAYYKKCIYNKTNMKEKALCEWVDSVVDYYNKICNNCMKREGTYPIVISWSDQTDFETLGRALPQKFKCNIQLAINENWEYDNGMKFRTTVLHEIGHCYGLDHDSDVRSLMYPSHNSSFTENDVLRFVHLLERIAN